MRIDLNADLGESTDLPDVPPADDAAMLRLVSSANVACGGHAGDQATMRRVGELASAHGVRIGAHISYRDRDGFGRRAVKVEPGLLRDQLIEQIHTLIEAVEPTGARVAYVKPHGALYHAIETDQAQAGAVVAALQSVDSSLSLLARAGVLSVRLAAEAGLGTVSEAFADRAYLPDGSLAPRRLPGAVLHDPDLIARRCLAIARGEPITDIEGGSITVTAQSICIHGDTPGAVRIGQRIRERLDADGVEVAPVSSTDPAGPNR